MKSYFKLFKFVRPHAFLFILTFIVMTVYSAINGFSIAMLSPILRVLFYRGGTHLYSTKLPYINDFLNNFIMRQSPLVGIERLSIAVISLYFIKGIFTYAQNILGAVVQERITKDIRVTLFEKLMHLPLSFFKKANSGDIISRFINDIKLVRIAITHGVYVAVRDSITASAYLVVAVLSSWRLSLIALLVIPLSLSSIVIINRTLKKRAKRAQESMGSIGSHLFEILSGIKLIKGFATEDVEVDNFSKKADIYYKRSLKFQYLGAISSPLNEFFTSVVAALLLYIGGMLIFKSHSITPDSFFVFLAAALSLMSPIKHLSQINVYIQEGTAAAERIFGILDISLEKNTGHIKFKGLKQGIRIENLSFKYDDSEEYTLKDINLDLHKGERVAIVGHTGAGKSTLSDIITGFYNNYEGHIQIDNIELRDIDAKSYKEHVSIVPQDVFLFSGTIRDNLTYGIFHVSEKDMIEIARKTLVHDFVKDLPNGYDTVIGERGVTLSGGERQRIAVARAMLRKTDIIILDEATSALDTESEEKLKDIFYRELSESLMIIIAHRLSTVKDADRIVVVEQGRIIAAGKHQELLNTSDIYKRLYKNQLT